MSIYYRCYFTVVLDVVKLNKMTSQSWELFTKTWKNQYIYFSLTFSADIFYSLYDAFEVSVSHVVDIYKIFRQLQ